MPPAQRPVDISPRNGSRSTSTTSFTPRAARWYAVLAPITPPPTTTASAVLGISVARMSDQVGHYLGQWLPDPDHERDLLLYVPPGRRIAEAADAVDDPVELVGLERQDPLPVGEPERAGGVGEDVGELPPELAVLLEEAGPLLGRQEVPLRRADEGVHTEVPLGVLASEERRPVLRVELGRTDRAEERVGELQRAAQHGAEERGRQRLEVVRRSRHQPHENVGVGPESDAAVEAADRNRVGHLLEGHLPLLHGLLDRGGHLADSTEHRIEGVHGLVAHGRSSPSWPR